MLQGRRLLKPHLRGRMHLRFFALVSIPNLVQRSQRALLKIADWKACPLRMARFLARFYPMFQRRWLSSRARVLPVLAAAGRISTLRPGY